MSQMGEHLERLGMIIVVGMGGIARMIIVVEMGGIARSFLKKGRDADLDKTAPTSS